jgi:hypothetical protein
LLYPPEIAPMAEQKSSLTAAIPPSVPTQQQINLQTAPATVAPLPNSDIELKKQELKSAWQVMLCWCSLFVLNELPTFQRTRQLVTDDVQRPVSITENIVRSESPCALRLRYVDLVVSVEVAIDVCCCFTVFGC